MATGDAIIQFVECHLCLSLVNPLSMMTPCGLTSSITQLHRHSRGLLRILLGHVLVESHGRSEQLPMATLDYCWRYYCLSMNGIGLGALVSDFVLRSCDHSNLREAT